MEFLIKDKRFNKCLTLYSSNPHWFRFDKLQEALSDHYEKFAYSNIYFILETKRIYFTKEREVIYDPIQRIYKIWTKTMEGEKCDYNIFPIPSPKDTLSFTFNEFPSDTIKVHEKEKNRETEIGSILRLVIVAHECRA